MKKTLIALIAICLACTLIAEPLQEKLSLFDVNDAISYLQPLANTMGAGMNSGIYTSAKVLPPFRPNFRVGGTFALVPSSEKSFMTSNPLYESVETATIFGTEVGEITLAAEKYLLPKGADLSLVPIPQMMVSLGLPFGNEVMFRGWFETKISSEIGDIAFWGVGLKHSIDQYFGDLFPLDMSVLGFYQKMDIADFINLETYSANLAVSKKILMLTLYGGVGYEQAKMKAKYTYSIPGLGSSVQELDFDAKNDFSGTLGARLTIIPLLSVFGDFTFAHTSTINFGIGVGF